jgi:hypothetical protein
MMTAGWARMFQCFCCENYESEVKLFQISNALSNACACVECLYGAAIKARHPLENSCKANDTYTSRGYISVIIRWIRRFGEAARAGQAACLFCERLHVVIMTEENVK